jgi:hypothetical protein
MPWREPLVIALAGCGIRPGSTPGAGLCLAHFESGACLEVKTMTLSVGQRVTLLKIDDCLALTHRYELQIIKVLEETRVGYQDLKRRLAIVRQRGKRKDQYLDLAHDDILLDGWRLAFKADTEDGCCFSGNACYNLIGDPQAIKDHIENSAVFPVSDSAKAKIIVCDHPKHTLRDEDCGRLLYPEIETYHAVVNRMKHGLEV